MKSKISTQEIILKQKEQEEKARENELNKIEKEIDKIKRKITSKSKTQTQTKRKTKTIKTLQEVKDTEGNKQTTYRQYRPGKRKEKNAKTLGMKEINKKYAMHVSQTIMKSKTVTQGKISLLLTEQAYK